MSKDVIYLSQQNICSFSEMGIIACLCHSVCIPYKYYNLKQHRAVVCVG